jgi:hypothetical protein
MSKGSVAREVVEAIISRAFGINGGRIAARLGPEVFSALVWWAVFLTALYLLSKHRSSLRHWISNELAVSQALQRLWFAATVLVFIGNCIFLVGFGLSSRSETGEFYAVAGVVFGLEFLVLASSYAVALLFSWIIWGRPKSIGHVRR